MCISELSVRELRAVPTFNLELSPCVSQSCTTVCELRAVPTFKLELALCVSQSCPSLSSELFPRLA
jgi:hypothetical protein